MLVFFAPMPSAADGMTKEQGDAILQELKEIRKLLEKNQRAAAPKQGRQAPTGPVKVSIEGGTLLGDVKAPLTLVEFMDFQCPYCVRFHKNVFPRLKTEYIDTGKLRYVARNLPLRFHAQARNAAQAALCAGDQGKYWQMRDTLFRNMQKLEPEQLVSYADGLSLDMGKYKGCVEGKKYMDVIDKDMADARKIGITGTPSFVLGKSGGKELSGERVVGAQPYSAFETRIKKLLGK